MSKRMLSVLAMLIVLAAVFVFSVSAQSAEPVCPHCNVALSQITWETWSGTAGDFSTSGHYRLAADLEQGGQVKLTGGDVVLDLAGCQLSTASNRPIYVNGGTMTILDTVGGAVVKGKATASGSTLFVNANGTLHIYGGTYESAATTGKDGGTMAVSGNVTLHDGTIKGSTSTTAGGCLQLTKGSFTMNGGLLTAGNAATSGGTIFAKAGTLTLNGGTIEAGTVGSGKSGKAVFAYTAATTAPCTVNIGSVTVDSAASNGFVIGTNTTVNISGAPKLNHLSTSSPLTIGELTDGASIYLAFTNNATLTQANANMAAYLEKGYLKAAKAGVVLAMENDTTIVAESFDCPHCDATDIAWTAWTGTVTDGTHYYLSADQELTKVINVPKDTTITLDLHGKAITSDTVRAFLVYGNLNLVDSGKTGKVTTGTTGTNGGVFSVQAGGHAEVYGGTYIAQAAPNIGSVAYVLGSMTIHEGVTLDGSAAKDTAKVPSTVYSKGSFAMDGGVIIGAEAKRGGSIFVEAGSLSVTGGHISGGVANATEGSGDDIYVLAATNVTLANCTVEKEFHINAADVINISGAPVLGKLKLSTDVLLTLGELTDGAAITVAANGVFTNANENAKAYLEAGYITSSHADRAIVAVDGVLKIVSNDGPKCPHCGQLMDLIEWLPFNAAGIKSTGGHYYLTADVNRTLQLQIDADVDSVIDLRGCSFTVTKDGTRAFLVNQNATLSVMDTVGEGVITGKNTGNGGTINVQAGATLNLYSGIFTAGSTAAHGGVIYTEGNLNISGGTVRGGKANLGGNIYAGEGAVVTISGGIIGGGQASSMGGNLYAAEGATVTMTAGSIQNGKSDSYGGNIAVAAGAVMEITDGYIRNGNANQAGKLTSFRGDNLYLEGTVTLYKAFFAVENTEMPGSAILARGSATLNLKGERKNYSDVLNGQVHLLSTCTLNADFGELIVCRYGRINWYKTLDAAIADFGSWENHRYVKLLHQQDVTTDKDLYLDVNGMEINVTVAAGATLYGMDTTGAVNKETNTAAPGTGSVTLLGEGTMAVDADCGDLGRYIAITRDGKTTFHVLQMEITTVTLRTSAAGFYYKAVYICDEVLAPYIQSYGVVLSVNNMPGADFMTETGDINAYTILPGNTFVSGAEVTSGSVFNIMRQGKTAAANKARGEMKIYANVYVVLDLDGAAQTLVGDHKNAGLTVADEAFDGVAYSLYDVMQLVNDRFDALSEAEQAAVREFYDKWYDKGMQDWALPSLATLAVGFGRVDITPDFPVYIAGGNVPNRISTEVKDHIYVTCVAITDDTGNTALILTQDLMSADMAHGVRTRISNATGVPFKNIMVSATHTHSAPAAAGDYEGVAAFQEIYYAAVVEAAQTAMADRTPAAAQVGSTLARTENNKQLVFVRRYKQLDGGYRGGVGSNTNSPLISHAYEANETMQVIKFLRCGEKKDVLLTNLGAHATFNGATTLTAISADFPGAIRDYVESNSNCLSAHFISGGADQNPTTGLAWEDHGLNYVAYGQAVAKAALATTLTDVATGNVTFASKVLTVGTNKLDADAETVAKAEQANAVFETEGFAAGEAKAVELGFVGIYQARAILNHQNLADTMDVGINVLTVGELSFAFASYELFGGSAAAIVENSPYENTFVISCANGSNGYVPVDAAYDMGCYESYTARVARGSAEALTEAFHELLVGLHQ